MDGNLFAIMMDADNGTEVAFISEIDIVAIAEFAASRSVAGGFPSIKPPEHPDSVPMQSRMTST